MVWPQPPPPLQWELCLAGGTWGRGASLSGGVVEIFSLRLPRDDMRLRAALLRCGVPALPRRAPLQAERLRQREAQQQAARHPLPRLRRGIL